MASAAQTPISQFAGYADLPGVRLWYTDSGGNGVPLVLLHGTEVCCTSRSSFRATPAKAGGDPESRNFKYLWISAFAGMTEKRRTR